MDRAALDEFFAHAEDVLDNWEPGIDAMVAKVPDTDDAEALPGDSYYVQREREPVLRGVDPLTLVERVVLGETFRRYSEELDRMARVAAAPTYLGLGLRMVWVLNMADAASPTREELAAGIDLTGTVAGVSLDLLA